MKEEICKQNFSYNNDVLLTLDNQYRILSISPNVESLFGYKSEVLIGRPFPESGILSPKEIEEVVDDIYMVFSGRVINSSLYELITQYGVRKFGEVSWFPIKQNDHVRTIAAVIRDITGHIKETNRKTVGYTTKVT